MKQIKVLQFICSSGFYGAERWVLALAKNLQRTEIVCDLVITNEGQTGEPEIVEPYERECGDVYQLDMKHRFDFFVVDKLVDLIKQQDIDIIHTHGYKSDILGLWAARKAGIQIVMTPHGFSTNIDFKLKTFIWLGCQMFRFADRVAPLSPQLMEDMRRYKVKQDRLVYVQNGVDLSEAEAQREKKNTLPVVEGEKRIGFIGQMIERKNIRHILDIFDELHQRHGNMRLFLLGDGESRSGLEAYADGLTSASHIEFLGFRDDRMEWLQSFDLFVMTSILEGIPRCLMETMAMGVPVAAYDISGVDQLVKHNETGLLAPLNDKPTLTKHWETILFDQSESARLVMNARDYVQQHYSAKRMADEYSSLFNDMMKG